ncbi:MAG: AsmA-like C-terminal region-containing protein [Xanthobacteraceae bacterium]|nr:AsmA-like C-terminal region-containing protein [Xanthobacteraceae bacterium]
MQTTLLGLAIAVILALLAALIGPYFVDWNQFRPQFEAEATRLVGAPVRVRDNLDARLLPTPTLRLKAVAIGEDGDAGGLRADRLDVEFSLGALMRGEWRATELTLDGVALELSLDEHGRVAWPGLRSSNLGALAIDRLRLGGRVVVHDAASRATVAFDDITFAGDVRALAGAARGDGEFRYGDVRYPFRLATSRAADGAATRLHFAIDPGVRPIGLDLDGLLTFEAMVPHFDGAVILSRAITLRGGEGRTQGVTTPWKLSAKLRADPQAAKLDQLDVVYGSDDVGLKLSGSADIGFGPSPSLRVALSARQLDADRLLARETAAPEPTRLLPGLRGLVAALPPPPFATRISLGADAVTLGGRQAQSIAVEAHSDAADWVLDRFEGRLPGAAQVSLGGRLSPHPNARFSGALKVEAADPELLSAWLRGANDSSPRSQKPLKVTGLLGVSPDRIALDDVDADIDGAAVTGRLAVSSLASAPGATRDGLRLEAAVNGEKLDLDGLVTLARSFAGPRDTWPDEADIAIDLGHGSLGGHEFAPFVARLGYGPDKVTLTRLALGAAGGVTVDGGGAIDRATSSGRLAINAGAPALQALTKFAAPFLPEAMASRMSALPEGSDGAAKLKLALSLDKAAARDGAAASATVDIDSPHVKGTLRGSVTSPASILRDLSVESLAHGQLSFDGKLAADRGAVLLGLIGLDHAVASGDGAARAEGSLQGTWDGPLSFKLAVNGANLDADAQGTLAPAAVAAAFGAAEAKPGDPRAADGKGGDAATTAVVAARKLDLGPLFDIAPGRLPVIALTSRVGLSSREVSLNEVDATVAGARVRGHLVLTRGKSSEVRGEFGMDRLDLATALAMATGALGRGLDEPLGRPPCAGTSGTIELQTPRGVLPGGLEVRAASGKLRCDGAALSLAGKGAIGGGEAAAEMTVQGGTDGVAVDAHVQLSGVDGASLTWRGLAPPTGKTALQLTLSGRGRTAGVIAGALSGGGTWSVDQARIGGLDPAAFDAAVVASDAGRVNGDAALRDLMTKALKGAPLAVASAQIPFSLRDGGLRVAQTTLDGDGARLVVSGGYDLTADQFDLRAELASSRLGTSADRPAIEIFAHGPPDHLNRSIDVALLSSWLAVRAIDRETRRLESLERGDRAAPTPPPSTAVIPAPTEVPTNDQPARDQHRVMPKLRPVSPIPAPPQVSAVPGAAVPPLPPPIDIRPVPGAARSRLPRAPQPPAPVPPASVPN